jgi:hypothetical protein
VYVRFERYNAVPWMARSVYVRFERYITITWPLFDIRSFKALLLPCTLKKEKASDLNLWLSMWVNIYHSTI